MTAFSSHRPEVERRAQPALGAAAHSHEACPHLFLVVKRIQENVMVVLVHMARPSREASKQLPLIFKYFLIASVLCSWQSVPYAVSRFHHSASGYGAYAGCAGNTA